MLLCCITLSSPRKTNASSRHSKKDFWRRCQGGLRSSQDIPSTHHKLISLAFTLFAICLPFSSPPLHPCRFIRPLFPNLLSFPLAFFFLSLSLAFFCLLVCMLVLMALPKSTDLLLRRLEEIESNIRTFMTLQFEHSNFFRK